MTSAKRNPFLITAVLLMTAVILSFPIYYFGMPAGNDLPQHYRFALTFYHAIHTGDVYPAWAGDTNLGFGDVGIRFYPPLAYYAVVAFRSFTDSWNTALAMSICFWFLLGGGGMFLLARQSFSEKASLIAAIVFMAMPYHVNQVYNAGLFAEFTGLAILPYCFLFVKRTISNGRIVDVASLAVAYALLLLAHLPLAIIGSIGLAVYTVALLERRSLGTTLIKLTSSVLTALAASSFYWVRMLSELSLVSHTRPEFTGKAYDFRLNFLGSLLYLPSAEYSETSGWFTDLLFAITLAMILPALTAFLLMNKEAIGRRKVLPFAAVLVATILVSTPLSALLWEHIEVLRRTQFPWRFLGLISLAGAILIAASIDELPAMFKTKLRPIGLIVVGLIVAGIVFTGAQVIRPARFSERAAFDNNFDTYRDDKSCECWWPVWAETRALANRERISAHGREVEISEWKSDDRSFIIGEGSESEIRIATFYYPFWKATANGSATEVSQAEDGTMTVKIGQERSELRLFFERPTYEIIFRYLSMFVWALLVVVLIAGRLIRRTRPELV